MNLNILIGTLIFQTVGHTPLQNYTVQETRTQPMEHKNKSMVNVLKICTVKSYLAKENTKNSVREVTSFAKGGLLCLFVLRFYGPVNNEVMLSRSVNSGSVPGQA